MYTIIYIEDKDKLVKKFSQKPYNILEISQLLSLIYYICNSIIKIIVKLI